MTKGSILKDVVMWGAGLIASIALAYTASTNAKIDDANTKNNQQDTALAVQHQSLCIQNENIKNISVQVHASFVSDPSCK